MSSYEHTAFITNVCKNWNGKTGPIMNTRPLSIMFVKIGMEKQVQV